MAQRVIIFIAFDKTPFVKKTRVPILLCRDFLFVIFLVLLCLGFPIVFPNINSPASYPYAQP